VPKGGAPLQYTLGGLQIGTGGLYIYSGLQQDDIKLKLLGVTGGATQVVGGASWIYGIARESTGAISFASKANMVGQVLTAPLTIYEVGRDLGAPGEHANRSWEENTYSGLMSGAKLAAIIYPEAAIAAIALEYGVKPVAQKISDYATPKFIGAMSQAYNIPEQYLWGMH
jgi:hypothetical protein